MAKLKKGQEIVCVPCGREVVVNSAGISCTTIWCCGRPMQQKSQAVTAKEKAAKPVKKRSCKR